MPPVFASDLGISLPDVLAGSALLVALVVGGSGVWLRHRATSVAGGIVAMAVVVFMLTSLNGAPAERYWQVAKTVIVFIAATALLVLPWPRKK